MDAVHCDPLHLGQFPAASVGRHKKFAPGGAVCSFPGSTVICFVAPASPLGRGAALTRRIVEGTAAARRYTMMPPSSWHMTVIGLLNDYERTPLMWSSLLAPECPLDAADAFVAAALDLIEPPHGITMRYRGLRAVDGLVIELDPADTDTEQSLRAYRDAAAAAAGVRRPDHAEYVFHIGLGYRTAALRPSECDELLEGLRHAHTELVTMPTFDLTAPALTYFEDMTEFRTARQPAQRHSV